MPTWINEVFEYLVGVRQVPPVEQYRRYFGFKVDRRKFRKVKSNVFMIFFLVSWSGVVFGHSGKTPKDDSEIFLWLIGLLVLAYKKIYVDSLAEIKEGMRKLMDQKQDKTKCEELHKKTKGV